MVPPLDESLRRQNELLSAFKEPWKTGWEQRSSGKLIGECQDKFMFAYLEQELVGRIWYTVKNDFATFGWVFTSDKYRGLGISTKLIEYTLDFLDKEPGLRATYLGVGVNKPIPRAMYSKHGWRPYNDAPNTCIMRRFKNAVNIPDFDALYFTGKEPYQVRSGKRSDLPGLEALYNLMEETAWFGRNYVHDIYGRVAVEGQIDAIFNEVDQGRAIVEVLEDARKKILGVGYCRRSEVELRSNHALDFFIAPKVKPETLFLLNYMLDQPVIRQTGNIITSQSSGDPSKIELLAALGFRETERIGGYHSDGNKKFDRLVFCRAKERM